MSDVKLSKASQSMMRFTLRLLDMEYKPSELAEELHTDSRHILSFIGMGCPARKDSNGRYWLHGETFARWMRDTVAKNDRDLASRPAIADNEAYCVKCRAIVNFTEYRRAGRVAYGNCKAGHKVTRFVSIKKESSKPKKTKGK
jgi:hypothetical protein